MNKGKEKTKTFKFSKEEAITILTAFATYQYDRGVNERQNEIAREIYKQYPELRKGYD